MDSLVHFLSTFVFGMSLGVFLETLLYRFFMWVLFTHFLSLKSLFLLDLEGICFYGGRGLESVLNLLIILGSGFFFGWTAWGVWKEWGDFLFLFTFDPALLFCGFYVGKLVSPYIPRRDGEFQFPPSPF